jgi:hypothetical protein
MTDEPTDGWKQFIRTREQFVCTGIKHLNSSILYLIINL